MWLFFPPLERKRREKKEGRKEVRGVGNKERNERENKKEGRVEEKGV